MAIKKLRHRRGFLAPQLFGVPFFFRYETLTTCYSCYRLPTVAFNEVEDELFGVSGTINREEEEAALKITPSRRSKTKRSMGA